MTVRAGPIGAFRERRGLHLVLFVHSIRSDWNHGNAHFLRGLVTEWTALGHTADVYEPQDGWSASHLVQEHGTEPLRAFERAYPDIRSVAYRTEAIDLERALEGADLVLVHEWNPPELVRRIGAIRSRRRALRALFHDTHHRAVTKPDEIRGLALDRYDGVLAFGRALRDAYRARGWARAAWVWHEAADTRVFRPLPGERRERDLVWVGNWGDEERTREFTEFLLEPARDLGLRSTAYGVRYPPEGLRALEEAGIRYEGWLPNYEAPRVFARHRVTVHVPRAPYARTLPGIPTIRVFEALACGIPLVSAPWDDVEGLFTPGRDFLVAPNGAAMRARLRELLHEPDLAHAVAARGLATIRARHTCAHRVRELLAILRELGVEAPEGAAEALLAGDRAP